MKETKRKITSKNSELSKKTFTGFPNLFVGCKSPANKFEKKVSTFKEKSNFSPYLYFFGEPLVNLRGALHEPSGALVVPGFVVGNHWSRIPFCSHQRLLYIERSDVFAFLQIKCFHQEASGTSKGWVKNLNEKYENNWNAKIEWTQIKSGSFYKEIKNGGELPLCNVSLQKSEQLVALVSKTEQGILNAGWQITNWLSYL